MKKIKFDRFISHLNVSLVIFTGVLLCAAMIYYLHVRSLPNPEDNLLFIQPCFFAIAFCGIIIIAKDVIKAAAKAKADDSEIVEKSDTDKAGRFKAFMDKNKQIILMVLCAVMLCIIKFAGFFISAFLFLVAAMYLSGAFNGKIVKILIISFVIVLILYLAFGVALQVKLPVGILGF